MLQQTRVAAVIPYYEKFLRAFPDARALAMAPEDLVLTMWSGLGYYSRARNLRKAAQQICEGGFPGDYESIRGLAGVGDYTAAAIGSIAFGLPHAAVDGNVRRVMIRLANDADVEVPKQAARLLDRRDAGRWNQAVMELGATICLPRDPRCGECPVAPQCGARAQGTQNDLPPKRVKPDAVRLTRTLLVIRRKGRILLAPSPRVHGFWDLPEPYGSTLSTARISTARVSTARVSTARMSTAVGEFRHTITHRHYRFVVRQAVPTAVPKGCRWFADEQLDEIPLSTTAKKALRCLRK